MNIELKKALKLVDSAGLKRFNSASFSGRIAQLVEQRIENPRVPGSIPGSATIRKILNPLSFFYPDLETPCCAFLSSAGVTSNISRYRNVKCDCELNPTA